MSTLVGENQKQGADLLVLGGDLVTMDAARRVVRNGAVAIQEGRISWIGDAAEARRIFEPRRTLDASGRILLPGLVDTHFHTAQQLLRGKITELARRRQLKLPIWRNYLIPFESVLTEEDVHLSAQLAYTNLLRVGTTCFTDAGGPHPTRWPGPRSSSVFGACRTVHNGRGGRSPRIHEIYYAGGDRSQRHSAENLGSVRDQASAWAPGCRCGQLLVCSRELWETFRDLADETGSRVHIHLAEGTYEVEYAAEHWGKRPAEYLEEIGFLGPRAHAAHSILLSADEIDLYAERKVTAAHCPLGNFTIGPPKVPEMRRRGIAVGLGTDGASTGSLDLFEAIRVSFVAMQSNYGTPWHDRSALSLEDLLEMATLGGARALGMADHIGSLEVGKRRLRHSQSKQLGLATDL